jgi:hypothetical protein
MLQLSAGIAFSFKCTCPILTQLSFHRAGLLAQQKFHKCPYLNTEAGGQILNQFFQRFCDGTHDLPRLVSTYYFLCQVYHKASSQLFSELSISTVWMADQINVLREGQIIEEGNHDELLAQGGHYAELYTTYFRHQSLEYRPW